MAENAVSSIKEKNLVSIVPMRVLVAGRIENSRSHDGKRYTHVMTPAADAYSRPQLLEIRSKARLGEKGEEITVSCVLGGYQRKAYQAKDKNSGEIQTVTPVEHTLDLVELD